MKSIGYLLRPKAFAPAHAVCRDPQYTADNSGMSGAFGATDTRDNDMERMWLTQRDPGEDNWIGFDFGAPVRLGLMRVWNFNQPEATGSGIKAASILYSCDGTAYTEFKGRGYPFVFERADGSPALAATDLCGGGIIDFEGLTARIVKIKPAAKQGIGNYGGYAENQNRFGLAAVRFYAYKPDIGQGAALYPYIARADGCAMNLTSGYGLEGGGADALHGDDPRTMWLSESCPADKSLVFDFGGSYCIADMAVWNYNAPGCTAAGLKNVIISYSLDGHEYHRLYGGKPVQFARADGKPGLKATNGADGKPIPLDDVYCRYLKLEAAGGAGNGTWGFCNGYEFRMGLSKVLFRVSDSGYYCEPAYEWSALFSNYNGWGGGDGLFSVSLDGRDGKRQSQPERDAVRTLFVFGDTFLGNANPVTRHRRTGAFVNNSMALMNGLAPRKDALTFIYGKDGDGTHTSIIRRDKSCYYWLQDCAVVGGTFYSFTDNIESDPSGPEGFQFKLVGVDMVSIPVKDGVLDYPNQINRDTPLYSDKKETVYFGAGILVNTAEAGMPFPDGYVYIYGILGTLQKQLAVCRVKSEDIERFDRYAFFDGKSFAGGIENAAAIADDLSSELSVTPVTTGKYQGKYLFVYCSSGVGDMLCARVGDTPYGPFGAAIPLYYAHDDKELDKNLGKKTYRYNAKGHYHLSGEGELLISYNINSTDFESHFQNADIYRPRFVRLKQY